MSDKAEYLSGLRAPLYCASIGTGGQEFHGARHPAAGRSMPRSNPEGAQARKPQESAGRFRRAAWPLTPGEAYSRVLCPAEPHARRVGADQNCGPTGCPPAQPLNLPSSRTLLLRALWQCSRSEVIMHENAAGRGCVAASLPWYSF